MNVSKTQIDKAGETLVKKVVLSDQEFLECDSILDEYRKSHLQPLTECTLELQSWLADYSSDYYIAQRLKRKPQILRKLKRLGVRLTQLQDIGGCRIIVDTNADVEKLQLFISDKLKRKPQFSLFRTTDYRVLGRDDTGYRALHLILHHGNFKLELQVRSRLQHTWAESIERTSVVYGYHLKEKEGAPLVIGHFKELSDAIHKIESGRTVSMLEKVNLEKSRESVETIIRQSDKNRINETFVSSDIIKTLMQIEKSRGRQFNNWLIVFDWNTGSFINWDIVERNPEDAIRSYAAKEMQYPDTDGFEVVLIGSSDVETVKSTHSHYFGVDKSERILEGLYKAVPGISTSMDIDADSRQILIVLHRRNYWGNKCISLQTLKNHYCKQPLTFEASIKTLRSKGLVVMQKRNGAIALNPKNKRLIESYL